VIGKKVNEIIPEPSLPMVLEKYRQVIREKTIVRWEETSVYPTGQVTGEVGIAPIFDKEGHCTHLIGSVHDITGRKRMEEALRESEVRFRTIFENQQNGLIMVDAQTHVIVDANRIALSLIGAPRDDVMGRVCHTFICPSEEGKCPVTDLGHTVDMSERVLFNIKGERIPIIKSVSRITLGDHSYLIESFTDITDRKRAEEALRESEARYQSILNASPDVITITDMGGVVRMVSPAALSMFGFEREDEMLGRSLTGFIAPEDRDRAVANIALMHQGIFTGPGEYRALRVDGSTFDIEVNGEFIRNRRRQPTGMVFVVRDITDRKRAEEALRASEERYRGIFEYTTVAVFQTRIDGSIATANPAFARLLKYETPEIVIREVPDIRAIYVDPNVRDELYRLLVTQGVVENFEFALRCRDGSTLWASVNVRAVHGDDGTITGLEGLAVDITDRKKTEENLREVNKKLTLLSRITRHDINNQLMLVQAYLEILKEKKPDSSFTAFFQKVGNAARRISSMIQFTREYEEIGVNAPVWQDCHALADTAAMDAPLGKIIIKNDLPSGTEVFADPLIVKVFYNLMDNAIRYGRKITTIRFSLQESGEDHLILCEDDGDGISADEKERIFERDFGRNTGLGLFLSREVLAITGITIRETGVPGKGARFEMTVPKNAYRLTVMDQV
jgi:PAS domain S-box-containing protein